MEHTITCLVYPVEFATPDATYFPPLRLFRQVVGLGLGEANMMVPYPVSPTTANVPLGQISGERGTVACSH